MSKGIVVECPKGVYTRIMPGSTALELYNERNKGPKELKTFTDHMKMLHTKYLKEIGHV